MQKYPVLRYKTEVLDMNLGAEWLKSFSLIRWVH